MEEHTRKLKAEPCGSKNRADGEYVLSGLMLGDSRLVVRHNAAVEPIDITLSQGGVELTRIEGQATPDEVQVDVPAGRYEATISLSSDPAVSVGPVDLQLRKTRVQIVYAVGSLDGGNFDLLVPIHLL